MQKNGWRICWFINEQVVGQTKPDEIFVAAPNLGNNGVKAVDDFGQKQEVNFRFNLVD